MTSVSEALRARISIREFLPTPVPESLLREVLDAARWSPSGGNLQPWKVIAVAGEELRRVTQVGLRHAEDPSLSGSYADPSYPANLWEPYRTRRHAVGEALYAQLGIAREDRAGRLRQFGRNFVFFGAPVALFYVLDRGMGRPQWAHLGMFMQSVALAACERGLGTCFQESWGILREELHRHFGLSQSDYVYCGMALGYANPAAAANRLRSNRAEVSEFATFLGFGH